MAAPAYNHVWVGTETGILKGINLQKKQALNYTPVSSLNKEQEITAICWADTQESEVLLGCGDGTVKVFSAEKSKFTEIHECRGGEGTFRGLAVLDNAIVTCVESGLLKVWQSGGSDNVELQVGAGIERMRQCQSQPQQVGTGGRENDLKIWDLARPEEPVFKAKNVRNDWLDLRVPVWIRDFGFIPKTDQVVTCTGHHQVRIYDPKCRQKRPVLEVLFQEDPLTALSVTPDGRAVVVGNSHGNMGVIDLRKGKLLCTLKGNAGSIRSVQCHSSMPLVASCGLDRFLRIHNFNDKTLLHKVSPGLLKIVLKPGGRLSESVFFGLMLLTNNIVYLKSRLNCLLLTSRDKWEEEDVTSPVEQDIKDEEDEVWDTMETVTDIAIKKRQVDKTDISAEGKVKNPTHKKKKCA